MRYFNIIWFPFACVLSVVLATYFALQHLKFYVEGKIFQWRKKTLDKRVGS